MRKLFQLSLLVFIFSVSFGQSKKVYTITSGEWIFSFADITHNGTDASSILRFSPVFNFQNQLHFDQSDNFGFFTGLGLRNVGFIYDVPGTNTRKKYRSYNVGIPLGIKVGDLNNIYFYGGYEIEFAINYKEKTFTNEDKTDKNSVWFSKQTPTVNNTLFAGVQLPSGANIKFKYYLTNFFNKGYTAEDSSGSPYQPYQNMDVNVFYFSLNFFILKDMKLYYSPKDQSTSPVTRR